ncbi:5'-methylthioadenosine/S-adenosylhomocysteine nucleosidase [Mycolicibacterium madagascariense]|uniref:adenosylhomocysteine nucleosidase n=1 Tax=Mycolicibacterium madagascariense TaxID=212765 RepID=A0A7I7XAY0_9MYCO|nr:5'-methylthioadenosine/adenosylhomocysteine nucleosidase [Mycolicibacterium madagascariense]MCV7013483.1 5'-methylthioadenosine/adenosylhomocysteine nucleosidase [Mycolicibacterium madagascariense]BBZ26929.1 5'-methylthioadenosine/S-adenosylhomocysteine nucleosidase [Mycolicibacterium madagascariense]
MTVGLLCALPEELTHLGVALADARATELAHVRFDEGTLDGHPVVLAGAGMGKVNAAVVTTLLIERFGCRAVVLSGVAGGLDPTLHVGDVVVANRVIQHDAGLVEDDTLRRYQAGHVPFINPTEALGHSMDPELLATIRARLDGMVLPALPAAAGGADRPPRIAYGTVLTGDQYVHCETTRQRLVRELNGLAVEMEGGAVAQVCETFGIPWVVVRALSDLAGHDSSLDFTAFAHGVAAISARLVRALVPVL